MDKYESYTLPHFNTHWKQSVTTFLFLNKSPPKLIFMPILPHPTNLVLKVSIREVVEISKFAIF